MSTNIYNELIPEGVIFNLKQIQNMNLIKISMLKKIISQGAINTVKIGNKIHVSRAELIRYLIENTILATV